KALVAVDLYKGKFVPRPGIDLIDHAQGFRVTFLHDVALGIEMAAGLHVVEQIALSLVEQIFIDRVLFVDRDLALESSFADMKSAGGDQHHWTGIDLVSE